MLSRLTRQLVLLGAVLVALGCTPPGAVVSPSALAQPTAATVAASTPVQPAPAYQLAVSAPTVAVGQQLVVTVTRSDVSAVSGECGFLAYDMTLNEGQGDAQHFTFVSPQRLGPPAPATGVYTLTARLAGQAPLQASIYGETTCNGGFQWAYRSSNVLTVTVEPAHQAILPLIVNVH
jgi:hypothetical protein